MEKQRTEQQNKAMHLWFTQLSEELNEQGMDMRTLLKPGIQIPWNARMIKEYLFRPIMRAKLGKESTKELHTKEIDEIFDIINRALSEKGISVPFPSIDEMIAQQEGWKK